MSEKNVEFFIRVTFWEGGEPVILNSTRMKDTEKNFKDFLSKIVNDGPTLKNLSFTDQFGYISTIGEDLLKRSVIDIWKYSEKENENGKND
jgi:hypothetical protein